MVLLLSNVDVDDLSPVVYNIYHRPVQQHTLRLLWFYPTLSLHCSFFQCSYAYMYADRFTRIVFRWITTLKRHSGLRRSLEDWRESRDHDDWRGFEGWKGFVSAPAKRDSFRRRNCSHRPIVAYCCLESLLCHWVSLKVRFPVAVLQVFFLPVLRCFWNFYHSSSSDADKVSYCSSRCCLGHHGVDLSKILGM